MDNIAFVFQDSDLITDTVFNNVAMAKTGSTKEDVIKLVKKQDAMILLKNFLMDTIPFWVKELIIRRRETTYCSSKSDFEGCTNISIR